MCVCATGIFVQKLFFYSYRQTSNLCTTNLAVAHRAGVSLLFKPPPYATRVKLVIATLDLCHHRGALHLYLAHHTHRLLARTSATGVHFELVLSQSRWRRGRPFRQAALYDLVLDERKEDVVRKKEKVLARGPLCHAAF